MFLIFLFSYFVFANFRVFGPLMAGRETKSFESGIAPAFIVATLITLISHITYSFAKTLSNFAYVLVRVLPVAILYALILILTSSFPNLTSEEFLWAYLFLAYLYVAFFIHI